MIPPLMWRWVNYLVGHPTRISSTYVAVGELFGGSLSTSVLLEELVEFVCG